MFKLLAQIILFPYAKAKKGSSVMATLRWPNWPVTLAAIFCLSGCRAPDLFPGNNGNEKLDNVFGTIENQDLTSIKRPVPNDGMLAYINFAVAKNPEIAALLEAETIAKSHIDTALAQTRPQISATSAVGGFKADISNGELERGTSVSLTVSQLLFDGGMSTSLVSEAELGLALAEASTLTEVNRVSAEAANAGVSLVLATDNLTAVRQFKKELKPHVAQLKLMAQSGLIDRSVLDEVNGRWLEIDIAEQEATAAAAIAKLNFSKYFGDIEFLTSDFVLPETVQTLLLDKLSGKDSPKVRQATLRVMIAERGLERAKSAFSPKINAQAGSTSPMDPDENMNAQVGVMLTYQIGDGGARKADLDRAKASLDQSKRFAELQLENTETSLDSFDEKLMNIESLLKLANKKLPILIDQLNVAEKQIQTGQADVAKVFDIKLQLNEVQGRIRRSKADLAKTKIEKAAVLGLFSQ